MFNLIRSLVIAALMVVLPVAVTVAESQPQTGQVALKVGVIDFQQLLSQAPQAEVAAKAIEKEFSGRQDKLAQKQKEFQTKKEKWDRDRVTMSEGDRLKLEKDLTKLQQEFHRAEEEFRSDKTARYMEERDDFMSLVREVVDKYAQEKNFDLVLYHEAALYVGKIDITNDILQRLKSSPNKSKKS